MQHVSRNSDLSTRITTISTTVSQCDTNIDRQLRVFYSHADVCSHYYNWMNGLPLWSQSSTAASTSLFLWHQVLAGSSRVQMGKCNLCLRGYCFIMIYELTDQFELIQFQFTYLHPLNNKFLWLQFLDLLIEYFFWGGQHFGLRDGRHARSLGCWWCTSMLTSNY